MVEGVGLIELGIEKWGMGSKGGWWVPVRR